MAITRTQAVSAAATSVAITSTSANDIIVVFSYFAGTATIPTLAAGFTNIVATAGVQQAARLAFKVSTGGETTSGTWTNATQVVCMVFSGCNTVSTFGTTPTLNAGNSASLGYLAGTLTVTNGTSIWLGFGGASGATAGMGGNPTGTAPNFTNRASQATRINGCDTPATASNLSAQTLAVTTSGRWQTATIELKATPDVLPELITQAMTPRVRRR